MVDILSIMMPRSYICISKGCTAALTDWGIFMWKGPTWPPPTKEEKRDKLILKQYISVQNRRMYCRWKIYKKYEFFHVKGWRGHQHSISNSLYMFFVVLCCTALLLSSNFVKLYPCRCLDIWHYKYILFLRDFMWN